MSAAPIALAVPPVEAIVRLAAHVPVFPCRRHTEQVGAKLLKAKSPLTERGLHDATQDPEQIRAWWRRFPDALVGVPTGSRTNLVVLDYDAHKAQAPADEFISNHAATLLATRSHQTLNGGRHYLFRPPPGVKYRSGANITLAGIARPGLDIRAEGGYIIWWPLHGAMSTGETAPLPAGLIDERKIEAQELAPLPTATPEGFAKDRHRIADALAFLDPEDYDTWISCGMAIHFASTGGDPGFELWHAWSAGGITGDLPNNYSGLEDCRYHWASFGRNQARPVTLGTLFAAAKSKGYDTRRPLPDAPPMELPPIELYAQEVDTPPAVIVTRPAPINWAALVGQTPPERDWAMQYWLPMGAAALLAGDGGIGKTLLAQTIATAMAMGYEFIDHMPKRRKVLFWAGEDDVDEIWRRQIAICSLLGIHMEDLDGHLIVHSYVNDDMTLCGPVLNALQKTPMMDELSAQVGDYRADFVILDSVARIFGGSENNRHEVTKFIAWLMGACSVTGAGILLLGHPSKANGSEFSGSTAWEASVRSRLYLGRKLPDSPEEPSEEPGKDDGVRYLARRKSNYSSRDWRRFTFADGVLAPDGPDPARVATPGGVFAQDVVLRAVRALEGMGQHGTASTASPAYLPKLAQQFDLLEGQSKAAFAKAMAGLMKAGKLVSVTVGQHSNRSAKTGLKVAE